MPTRSEKPKSRPTSTAGRRAKVAPGQRLDVDERRAQLLALGLSVFSRRAYDEVSLDDLAREAGVSKGLFYHYFSTKRGLYVAALGEAARQLLERTEPSEAIDPPERLRAGLDAYLGYVDEHARAFSALLRGGVGSDPEVARVVERTRARLLSRMLDTIGGDKPSPALRIALRGWMGFAEAASLDWVAHRDLERGALVVLLIEMFVATVERSGGQLPPP